MSNIYIIKEQMMTLYAKWSRWIDMGLRFIVSIIVFTYINDTIGYMSELDNMVIVIALSVIAAFFPLSITVLIAVGLILAHLSAFHLMFMGVTAILFFLAFVFCFRFTAKGAGILLLTPISFFLGVPYVMPIAIGLVGTVAGIVPMILGACLYFYFLFVHDIEGVMKNVDDAVKMTADKTEVYNAKVAEVQALTEQAAEQAVIDETQAAADVAAGELSTATAAQEAAEATLSDLESGGIFTELLEQLVLNKELWIAVGMFVIGICVVYGIRKSGIAHNWKIATASGIAINFVVVIFGSMIFDLSIPLGTLILGNILALFVGLVFEVMFLGVNYNRTESLDFEDDEYVYYVKAVPKVRIAKKQKTVKKINSNTKKPNSQSKKSTGSKSIDKKEDLQQTRVIGKK